MLLSGLRSSRDEARIVIKVRVREDHFLDSTVVNIVDSNPGPGTRLILRLEGAEVRWEPYEAGTEVAPSLRLPDEVARALLDALHLHFAGASDTRSLRADYNHERGRVDRLIGALIEGRQP